MLWKPEGIKARVIPLLCSGRNTKCGADALWRNGVVKSLEPYHWKFTRANMFLVMRCLGYIACNIVCIVVDFSYSHEHLEMQLCCMKHACWREVDVDVPYSLCTMSVLLIVSHVIETEDKESTPCFVGDLTGFDSAASPWSRTLPRMWHSSRVRATA